MPTEAVEIAGRTVLFDVPNAAVARRVETLFTKEPATLAWIDGFAEGSGFWDVGANVGLYSIYAAVARGCHVVAVEPLPENVVVLTRNVLLNHLQGRITIVPMPVAEASEVGAFGAKTWSAGTSGGQFGGRSGVRSLSQTIDGLYEGYSLPKPQHIKVDVDGNEMRVLRGAARCFARSDVESVSVEVDASDETSVAKLTAFLTGRALDAVGHFVSPLYPQSTVGNMQFRRRVEAKAA